LFLDILSYTKSTKIFQEGSFLILHGFHRLWK